MRLINNPSSILSAYEETLTAVKRSESEVAEFFAVVRSSWLRVSLTILDGRGAAADDDDVG
jgi:hypothetical protein